NALNIHHTNTGEDYVTVTSSGNVGIGTTAPGGLLELRGVGSASTMFRQTTTGGGGMYLGAFDNTADPIWVFGTNASEHIQFKPGGVATSLYLDATTGNVGIGTTGPGARLHSLATTEQLRLGYDSSNYWSSTIGSTGGLTMQGVGAGGALTLSPTAGQNLNISLATTGDFAVNTSQLYVDTSTGNVGIGTTSPNYLLQLGTGTITPTGGFGGANALVKQLISDTTSGKYTQLAIQGPTNGGAAIEMYDGSGVAVADFGMNTTAKDFGFINRMTSGIMQFYTHDGTSLASRIYISSAGNVGIGTTGPATKLHVEQTAGVPGAIETIAKFTVSDDATNYLSIENGGSTAGVFHPSLLGYSGIAGSAGLNLQGKILAAADTGTNPVFNMDGYLSTNAVVATRPILRVRNWDQVLLQIQSSGNVGIGTTGPGAKIHALATSEQLRLGYDISNYSSFTTDSSGALAISTTGSGVNSITLNTTGGNINFSQSLNGISYQGSQFRPYVVDDNEIALGTTSARWSSINIGTSNSTFAGNVGIGTTAPGATLHVNSSNLNKLRFSDTAANTPYWYFQIDTSATPYGLMQVGDTQNYRNLALNPYGGNVGIGTTAPGQKLDIAGNIALSASGGGYIYGDTTTPNLRLSNSGGAVLSYGTISNISMGNPTIVLTAASAPRISLGAGLAFGSTYYSLTSPGTNNMIIEGGLGVGYSTLGTATLAINGNVGIGTTAPGNRLTLSTSGVDDTIPA
ncbi:hypothetical protein COY32_04885, partial [candidate division WWE3 bacterium CG_4_10_14_0_2_um_filter_41_14]